MAGETDCNSANFNIDDFIGEIENWPAIWDFENEDYSNKTAKRNAWEAVIQKFVPDFVKLKDAEKKVIGNSYQRKWKSLRDSFTRELAKQKNEMKSGSSSKFRKKYIFFQQLRFLDTTVKETEDSIELTDPEGNTELPLTGTEEITKSNPTAKGKKRHPDEQFLELLKKKYSQQETAEKDDDDKLFLLSLHRDLASLPDHMKLNVKGQILGVLASAKQAAFAYPHPHVSSMFPSTPQQHQQVPPQHQYHQNQPSTTFNRPHFMQTPHNYGNEPQNQPWTTTVLESQIQSPNDAASPVSDLSDVF